MKRQIRRGVFETNSSSAHSLVIKKDSGYYTSEELNEHIYLSRDGVWTIWGEDDLEFGRTPFMCLDTFECKVRYAIAALCSYKKDADDRFQKIEIIVREVLPDCKKICLPTEHGTDDEVSYGYVDEDILTGFLEKYSIDLKEFLINRRYVVIVDGDEYNVWDRLKDTGLIDSNVIETEYKGEWNYEETD